MRTTQRTYSATIPNGFSWKLMRLSFRHANQSNLLPPTSSSSAPQVNFWTLPLSSSEFVIFDIPYMNCCTYENQIDISAPYYALSLAALSVLGLSACCWHPFRWACRGRESPLTAQWMSAIHSETSLPSGMLLDRVTGMYFSWAWFCINCFLKYFSWTSGFHLLRSNSIRRRY